MRLRHFAKFSLSLILALALVQSVFGQKSYLDIKYPPLKPIKLPKVTRTVLPNGMIVLLVEDHELPLVEASMRLGVGGVYDPADKVGLAAITGEVIRSGGSIAHSGDEIDEALEQVGAIVEVGIGRTSGYATVSVLKEYTDLAFGILGDILEYPAFPEDKIELAKIEQRSAIARRNDDPMEVIMREFTRLIYGPQSPYARQPEYATIDRISRADLVAFHRRFFHPNNAILGVWGDFKTDEMIAQLKRIFGGWQKVPFNRPSLPEVKYTFDYSVNYI
ncbi:MAG TPA: insulinase family protein, partial [Bacteroidetes bacterium]|nr:insulinase family protein [Bacteroidota bacterium]